MRRRRRSAVAWRADERASTSRSRSDPGSQRIRRARPRTRRLRARERAVVDAAGRSAAHHGGRIPCASYELQQQSRPAPTTRRDTEICATVKNGGARTRMSQPRRNMSIAAKHLTSRVKWFLAVLLRGRRSRSRCIFRFVIEARRGDALLGGRLLNEAKTP